MEATCLDTPQHADSSVVRQPSDYVLWLPTRIAPNEYLIIRRLYHSCVAKIGILWNKSSAQIELSHQSVIS